jgi:hypothetical protein
MPDTSFWAITSYFNPAGYQRRYQNYAVFREHLRVPLVAVELSYGDEFELQRGDAEVVVRLRGSDVLWQKERLLNVALSHLPPECKWVAWLDCDLVFECADWPAEAVKVLQEAPLCQLYRMLYQLAPGAPIDRKYAIESEPLFCRRAVARRNTPGAEPAGDAAALVQDRQCLGRGSAFAGLYQPL